MKSQFNLTYFIQVESVSLVVFLYGTVLIVLVMWLVWCNVIDLLLTGSSVTQAERSFAGHVMAVWVLLLDLIRLVVTSGCLLVFGKSQWLMLKSWVWHVTVANSICMRVVWSETLFAHHVVVSTFISWLVLVHSKALSVLIRQFEVDLIVLAFTSSGVVNRAPRMLSHRWRDMPMRLLSN